MTPIAGRSEPLHRWLIVGGISVCLVATAGCTRKTDYSNTEGAIAVYSDCEFESNPSFAVFATSVNFGGIAHIYVEVDDGRRFFLPEFPEEVAATLLERTAFPDKTVYTDSRSLLEYRNGVLVLAVFDSISKLWRIGKDQNGPSMGLPIDRTTLIEEFGQPIRWGAPQKYKQGPT